MEKSCEQKIPASIYMTVNGAAIKLVFSKEPNRELPGFIKTTLLSAYIQKAAV